MRIAWLAVLVLPFILPAWTASAAGGPDAARRAQLVEMVRQDCGACHGLTLKGGLGPSLEPASLADRDLDTLAYVIQNGRHGTPMPAWRSLLTDSESRWIAEQLKQGLPR